MVKSNTALCLLTTARRCEMLGSYEAYLTKPKKRLAQPDLKRQAIINGFSKAIESAQVAQPKPRPDDPAPRREGLDGPSSSSDGPLDDTPSVTPSDAPSDVELDYPLEEGEEVEEVEDSNNTISPHNLFLYPHLTVRQLAGFDNRVPNAHTDWSAQESAGGLDPFHAVDVRFREVSFLTHR